MKVVKKYKLTIINTWAVMYNMMTTVKHCYMVYSKVESKSKEFPSHGNTLFFLCVYEMMDVYIMVIISQYM